MVILFIIMEYDGRKPGLPNAPVVTENGKNRREESTAIALNKQYNPYICTNAHIHIPHSDVP